MAALFPINTVQIQQPDPARFPRVVSAACPAGLHPLLQCHRPDPATGSRARVVCMDAQACLIKGRVWRDPLASVVYYILCTCQVIARW